MLAWQEQLDDHQHEHQGAERVPAHREPSCALCWPRRFAGAGRDPQPPQPQFPRAGFLSLSDRYRWQAAHHRCWPSGWGRQALPCRAGRTRHGCRYQVDVSAQPSLFVEKGGSHPSFPIAGRHDGLFQLGRVGAAAGVYDSWIGELGGKRSGAAGVSPIIAFPLECYGKGKCRRNCGCRQDGVEGAEDLCKLRANAGATRMPRSMRASKAPR